MRWRQATVTPLSCKMVFPATLNSWLNWPLALSSCGPTGWQGGHLTHAGLRLLTGLLALATGMARCMQVLSGEEGLGPARGSVSSYVEQSGQTE